MGKERINLGKSGENLAVKFLTRRGWQVVHRNYRTRWGEIDIVARDGDYYVFVEVKCSRILSSNFPWESVTGRKQSKISKMALLYLKHFDLVGVKARFDVVGVWMGENKFSRPKIELIENAFPLSVDSS